NLQCLRPQFFCNCSNGNNKDHLTSFLTMLSRASLRHGDALFIASRFPQEKRAGPSQRVHRSSPSQIRHDLTLRYVLHPIRETKGISMDVAVGCTFAVLSLERDKRWKRAGSETRS